MTNVRLEQAEAWRSFADLLKIPIEEIGAISLKG